MATRVMWMVYHEKGLWRDFPSELCIQTETLYQHNPVETDFVYWWPPHVSSGTHYQLDFVAMTQRNCRTDAVREIRRTTIHAALPEAVQGPSQRARTDDTVITGPSSSADPTLGSPAPWPSIDTNGLMNGYMQPPE